MSDSINSSPTSPTILLFARGVLALLDLWPALTIAVTEQWGGPESLEKKTWLASTIIDEFETHATHLPLPPSSFPSSSSTSIPAPPRVDPSTGNKPPLDHDGLADLLNQMMSDEFEANIEDGSIDAVTADIIRLWRDVLSENPEAIVEALERKAEEVKRNGVQASQGGDLVEVEDDDDDFGEDDEEDLGSMDKAMEVDEVPQLIPREMEKEERSEPMVDEEGFTLVQGKGRRR